MNVLVDCEESQEVTKAFRKKGFNAYSCDLQKCSGGHPEWHIKGDALEVLQGGMFITQSGELVVIDRWDLVIAHPPCTRLCKSGVRWLHERNLWADLEASCNFFKAFQDYGRAGGRIAIENPTPHKYARKEIGYYHQKFQPWHFGHKQKKETCLWLYNLPPLKYTEIVGPPPTDKKERNKWDDVHRKMGNVPERAKFRSKTFTGIAKAMAEQWGSYIRLTKEAEGSVGKKIFYYSQAELFPSVRHGA